MNSSYLNQAPLTNQSPAEDQSAAQPQQPVDQAGASKTISSKVKKSKDAFRTISEVADHLNVQQHVLRFWETKFSQIKPMKRGGGRRYYRPEDVSLLERIHHLLYTEGYTIKGVQKLLREQGKAQFVMQAQNQNASSPAKQKVSFETSQAQQAPADVESKPQAKKMNDQQRAVLEIMLDELKAMRAMLNN